ncbi:MAG: copper oxidase [Deltaproteobacteria bacterium]
MNRRTMLGTSLAALATRKALARAPNKSEPEPEPEPAAGKHKPSIVVPNGALLPSKVVRGVRIFHIVANEFAHEIAPGLTIKAWGYNGATPGPVLEATEGERVRIYVTNKLPEATTIHWHGVFVPFGMDGVGGLSQEAIGPGKTFKYEFTFDRAGTFMYHPHVDEMTQIALGMMGMIVVHPRSGESARVRDYSLMTHEMMVPIGARRADPLAMNDFNVLTFNGKAFPATDALVAQVGDRVRIRIGNLGPMDHHPIHLHGHAFEVVATDGGAVPASARVPETTVIVPVGTVRVVEFTARAAGDWPLHCHMTHHAMNQMGHAAANLVGADPAGVDAKLSRVVPGYMTMGQAGMHEMSTMRMPQPANAISMLGGRGPYGVIDMGGMFTTVKVRDHLVPGQDPGWYTGSPAAGEASPTDLLGDGITP